MSLGKKSPIAEVDRRWYIGGFHVHRLVVAVTMMGAIFNIFPLIYITTRQHAHFDVARVSTAVISLFCYLALYFGNTLKRKILYWPFLWLNTALMLVWLVASVMAIYFAGVLIDRLLHPDVVEGQLNIWWIINVAAIMTNTPQDYGRQNAEVPIAILLISSSLLALFGTLFQFYFLYVVFRAYRYLVDVLLNPNETEFRRVE